MKKKKKSLTLQEVQLTGGGVEAHEVEAAGGPAAASLSRPAPGGQTLQHAALPGPVQAEDQDLPLPALLLLPLILRGGVSTETITGRAG